MLNVDTAINLLCKLDYMKEYHAFGLLRVLNRSDLALSIKGDVEKHVKEMSSMVGFLFDVLPYEELKKRVRQQPELKHAAIGDFCQSSSAKGLHSLQEKDRCKQLMVGPTSRLA